MMLLLHGQLTIPVANDYRINVMPNNSTDAVSFRYTLPCLSVPSVKVISTNALIWPLLQAVMAFTEAFYHMNAGPGI